MDPGRQSTRAIRFGSGRACGIASRPSSTRTCPTQSPQHRLSHTTVAVVLGASLVFRRWPTASGRGVECARDKRASGAGGERADGRRLLERRGRGLWRFGARGEQRRGGERRALAGGGQGGRDRSQEEPCEASW